jgi:hypothetical protein
VTAGQAILEILLDLFSCVLANVEAMEPDRRLRFVEFGFSGHLDRRARTAALNRARMAPQ